MFGHRHQQPRVCMFMRECIDILTLTCNFFPFAGVGALWNGLFPTWVRQASNQGVRFAVVSQVAQALQGADPEEAKRSWHGFVSGGVAGGSSVLLNNPADVVKTRMMNQQHICGDALGDAGNARPAPLLTCIETCLCPFIAIYFKNSNHRRRQIGVPAQDKYKTSYKWVSGSVVWGAEWPREVKAKQSSTF